MEHLNPLIHDIEAMAPEFTALSDSIWDEPELRWDEHTAVAKQVVVAEKHGFSVTRDVAGIPTAFSAEKGSGGPVIAFLGEYDALAELSQDSGNPERCTDPANVSGNGQGCGHHLLGAGSLLAAVATARYLEKNGLPGRVRYYGCPAEEAAAGKSFMVKGGAFADVDSAITWHPFPTTLWKQNLMLAYTQVYFHFKGVAAHAGASPQMGRSALDAVELLNVGTNFLREHMPDTARIHYAITDAGGLSPNVVQPRASVYYIVRATDGQQMRELYERVLKVAKGAALMTETELTVEFDGACSEILPNEALEQVLYQNVKALGGVPFDAMDQTAAARFAAGLDRREIRSVKTSVGWNPGDDRALHDDVPEPNPTLGRVQLTGSSDVGDVSWSVPTVQIMAASVAMGTPFHTWQVVAQGKLPAAHKGMIYAAKAMAGTAVSLFADPRLVAEAKIEFDAVMAETPYICPIPDDVMAPPLRRAQFDELRDELDKQTV
ncbi:M20 family metallopeptidase [Arthrobacter sp. ISL-72]|uniref:M20 family metallopeptidase n=1 Tax=Arthrobacter sp. ISL-72 TaxID=2819114 RepID=UPI001BEA0E5F|nr:M20 family metallopeptidase [Arthrobacter sp. ISL-72]MBT2597888.1 amidohydrolase [Arthrobacter sp. ISL-72]